jgi:hypothetical protein
MKNISESKRSEHENLLCFFVCFPVFSLLHLTILEMGYVVCSKSIEPLVGRNTFIDLEVQNPNPLQSSLLGDAHTSPSASAIVGNTSGTRLLEW